MYRVLSLFCFVVALSAAEPPQETTKNKITEEEEKRESAIAAGLLSLRTQVLDAAFEQQSPGVMGIAGLAFLTGGNTPERGPHAVACKRIYKLLLAKQDNTTGLWTGHGAYLYDHAFALLFLADVAGTTVDAHLRPRLQAATDALLRCQSNSGGWRNTIPGDEDVSVTACVLQSLRAVYNTGYVQTDVVVPAMGKGMTYLLRQSTEDGGFIYSGLGRPGRVFSSDPHRFPLTAAGAAAMVAMGDDIPEGLSLDRSRQLMLHLIPEHLKRQAPSFWYGHYYASLVMFYGDSGKRWPAYKKQVFPVVLSLQEDDGSWRRPEVHLRPVYNTAMALIVLQMDNAYLPSFQK